MGDKKRFVIIDGNNICFRAFYALPMLQNFDGVISNAVFGFANTLVKIIEEKKPDYIAVAFDKGKNTFRHQMYKDYKAQRRPTPKELLSQLPLLKEMLETMHIKYMELDDIEADDIIGILSRKYDTENIIVSADKDVLQLINENTVVYAPQKGGDAIVYDLNKLKETMGLDPYQIIELKALMGDSSDNIPGVEGIGEKTALALINKYKNVEGVYKHIGELTPKQQEKLLKDKENAYFSKGLATIYLDYELPDELESFVYDYPFGDDTLQFFKKYQFNSLLRKGHIFNDSEKTGVNNVDAVELVAIKDLEQAKDAIDAINKFEKLYVYMDGQHISCSDGKNEYNFAIEPTLLDVYVPIDFVLEGIRHKLEDEKVEKYLFDAKLFMHDMDEFGIKVNNVVFDCTIAKYLVNGNIKTLLFYQAVDYFSLTKGYIAKNLAEMCNILSQKMVELELTDLYYKIELPLVEVLYDMEKAGIKVDSQELNSLDEKYEKLCTDLTEEIYYLAGTRFNLNSPKQLAEVLFDQMGLVTKENKKDSTKLSVLNELVGQHPIAQKIIDYRQYYKLYSTYIKLYQEFKDDKDYVHTIFNQTVTATGRLSSTEPNLQNIPTKSAEAKILRKIFIPSNPDGCLISADYSQIELRLLANFSEDERLINAYNNGEDIHALTASEIFGVPIDMVSDEMRSNAKAINFGIIYGISDWGLSQNIGITKNEAKMYIDRYFEKYPAIEEYMERNVSFAREHGYIRSIMGRIRFIPELKGNRMQQMFGERVAMNMPLQGSASDIIKCAMVKVYNAFKKEGLRSKLILQIHDELIVDAVKGEEDKVEEILRECMENAFEMKVRLTVNIGRGENLSEAK